MELQFHKTVCQYLQRTKYEAKEQEQTQDVRLGDSMPDIGRVLGAWGQVILRSKEWRNGQALVSGGIMAWVLYVPEDGTAVQSVETWLPFQIKWDLPDTQREGVLLARCLLRSVDARSVSARKLMVRGVVSVLAEALVSEQAELYMPQEYPQDVQILRTSYPIQLPKEAGEKPFAIEEELILPGSCPAAQKLIRYSVQPEIIEKKVLGGRVVFRGALIVHILYQSQDGQLCCWDFETPFSQYSELDQDYDQEATVTVIPMTTAMELDMEPEGKFRLKAGMTGQYAVFDRCMIELAEDAYSTQRQVELKKEQLQLPAVLNMTSQNIYAEQSVEADGNRAVDAAFYPAQPQVYPQETETQLILSGQFQLLYYDENGELQCKAPGWEDRITLSCDADIQVCADAVASGKPQLSFSAGNGQLRAGMLVNTLCTSRQGLPMITALELGEAEQQLQERPSLILRKKGADSLWTVAKSCGSTIEAIEQANRLTQEPQEDQILLIPVR